MYNIIIPCLEKLNPNSVITLLITQETFTTVKDEEYQAHDVEMPV